MKELEKLIDRIINRVNVNLREPSFDAGPFVRHLIPFDQYVKFYAFYGLTPYHPLYFHFSHASLAGSYFLGKCVVDHSVLYKSDIRGDELKCKGEVLHKDCLAIPLHDDEVIRIKDSFLVKTLVHNHSHDPENPEEFLIQNAVALHYANIHGSSVEGSFIGPFSTVDLTTLHDCVIGRFAYVQAGELSHQEVAAGHIWIRCGDRFDFSYQFDPAVLDTYVAMEPGRMPTGAFIDFIESHKGTFQAVYDSGLTECRTAIGHGSSLSRYAVLRGETVIGDNVLVAQRAFLKDAWLGKGANAQENCYVICSHLGGDNVTAHGGKIIHAQLGQKVFVGFNAFLRGRPDTILKVGEETVIMPHTIIDLEEPVEIPAGRIVWGLVRNRADLDRHSVAASELVKVQGEWTLGELRFPGSGSAFVRSFQHRIEHILEENGAYFDGIRNLGHAQKEQMISFNVIQPYRQGNREGIYPSIDIRP